MSELRGYADSRSSIITYPRRIVNILQGISASEAQGGDKKPLPRRRSIGRGEIGMLMGIDYSESSALYSSIASLIILSKPSGSAG